MPLQMSEEASIGEIKLSNNASAVLSISNLSSGIAVVLYDQVQHLGGLVHVLLPDSSLAGFTEEMSIGKFADLAIPELVQQFFEAGAQKQDTSVRIVGGAQLFNFGGGGGNTLNVGTRNAVAVRAALSKQGLAIEKDDVGGNKGRKIRFHIATGKLVVSQAGQEDYEV